MPTGRRPFRRPSLTLLLAVLALGLLSCRAREPSPRTRSRRVGGVSRPADARARFTTAPRRKPGFARHRSLQPAGAEDPEREEDRGDRGSDGLGRGDRGASRGHAKGPPHEPGLGRLHRARQRPVAGAHGQGPHRADREPRALARRHRHVEADGRGARLGPKADRLEGSPRPRARPRGWSSVGQAQFGAFRFGHTHPEASNSGLIALLAETYAAAGKSRGLTVQDVAKPEVGRFLAGIEKSVVHYGSSTGFFGRKMFERGPGLPERGRPLREQRHRVLRPAVPAALPGGRDLPEGGDILVGSPVGVVDREWVSAEHREAAEAYIRFLLEPAQQARAIPHGFRPASVDVPLGAPIDAAHGVDPRSPRRPSRSRRRWPSSRRCSCGGRRSARRT